MQAEKNTIVSFHYALTGENGEAIENSRDNGQPIEAALGLKAQDHGVCYVQRKRAAGEAMGGPGEGHAKS